MSVLRFSVPWRPVGVNALYERHPGGVHKSDAARDFHGAVATFGRLARRRAGLATIQRPVQVDVLLRFYFANERADADGPIKGALDAMQAPDVRLGRVGAGIYENDNQVRDHLVQKRIDSDAPRVEIAVGLAGEVFTARELLEQEARPA